MKIKRRENQLSGYEISFLKACGQVVAYQLDLVPALATSLGTVSEDVFYSWVMQPRCEQSGTISGTGWEYFFHGYECDLYHSDGRFIRVDFGPGGRYDTFTGWGVLQFIMTSKPPFTEFPELQKYLAEKQPPYDEFSGSFDRMTAIVDRLTGCGYIESSDPRLCALKQQYTTKDDEGFIYINIPGDYRNSSKKEYHDVSVCERLVLTASGKGVLTSLDTGEE
ncbi:MAG: hypothetical protein JXB88_02960 [Spirochaetales bacterium]|nr:hypothetical protein [Spirochaetales bacterium]